MFWGHNWARVGTVYSKIDNIGACWNMVNQRGLIADIDFVKNCKQCAMTLKLDPRQPPQTTTHTADRHETTHADDRSNRRGGRQCGWSSGRRRRERHSDGQVSAATVVNGIEACVICMWWKAWWFSGRALDLRFTGHGFNSWPVAFM